MLGISGASTVARYHGADGAQLAKARHDGRGGGLRLHLAQSRQPVLAKLLVLLVVVKLILLILLLAALLDRICLPDEGLR